MWECFAQCGILRIGLRFTTPLSPTSGTMNWKYRWHYTIRNKEIWSRGCRGREFPSRLFIAKSHSVQSYGKFVAWNGEIGNFTSDWSCVDENKCSGTIQNFFAVILRQNLPSTQFSLNRLHTSEVDISIIGYSEVRMHWIFASVAETSVVASWLSLCVIAAAHFISTALTDTEGKTFGLILQNIVLISGNAFALFSLSADRIAENSFLTTL